MSPLLLTLHIALNSATSCSDDLTLISVYDQEILYTIQERILVEYPRDRHRHRIYAEDVLTGANSLVSVMHRLPNVIPSDYAFVRSFAVKYAKYNDNPDLILPQVLINIKDAYRTKFGYTPTPEVTNTPDNHWAKIHLDTLYKEGILKGDPR